MQEIVPLILSGGDPASVESLYNWDRVPWLEEQRASQLNLEERPSPRMLTSHFQYKMMPPSFYQVKPKVRRLIGSSPTVCRKTLKCGSSACSTSVKLTDMFSSLKVIYVIRNPKDVFTSAFHYYETTSFMVNPGPRSKFLQKFLDGNGQDFFFA